MFDYEIWAQIPIQSFKCLFQNSTEPQLLKWINQIPCHLPSQLTFTCSKSTIETLEKYVKYVQS